MSSTRRVLSGTQYCTSHESLLGTGSLLTRACGPQLCSAFLPQMTPSSSFPPGLGWSLVFLHRDGNLPLLPLCHFHSLAGTCDLYDPQLLVDFHHRCSHEIQSSQSDGACLRWRCVAENPLLTGCCCRYCFRPHDDDSLEFAPSYRPYPAAWLPFLKRYSEAFPRGRTRSATLGYRPVE